MGRGWKRARELSAAPVPYPTTFLQGAEAKSQGEELRGHHRKRPAHPDLDSLDRDPTAEMAAPSVEGQMVLSNLASMLRLNLFTYRDLRKWLDDPFETPPQIPETEQLTLDLA